MGGNASVIGFWVEKKNILQKINENNEKVMKENKPYIYVYNSKMIINILNDASVISLL